MIVCKKHMIMDENLKYCIYCGTKLCWEKIKEWYEFDGKTGKKIKFISEWLSCPQVTWWSWLSKGHMHPWNNWGEYQPHYITRIRQE